MKAVEIRELENRLSEYIQMIVTGEEILVTDRGEVVALLKKPWQQLSEPPYPGLLLRSMQGKARLGAKNQADLYPAFEPLLKSKKLGTLLDQERGKR